MSSGVVDASILLAIIRAELQEAVVYDLLPTSLISTVNLAEVLTKTIDLGLDAAPHVHGVLGLLEEIIPFTFGQARLASELRGLTRHAGLSLGDRACLALAIEREVPAYTVDKSWMRVDVGCRVYCLR